LSNNMIELVLNKIDECEWVSQNIQLEIDF